MEWWAVPASNSQLNDNSPSKQAGEETLERLEGNQKPEGRRVLPEGGCPTIQLATWCFNRGKDEQLETIPKYGEL